MRAHGRIFFPLYSYPVEGRLEIDERGNGPDGRRANVDPEFIRAVSEAWGLRWIDEGAGDFARSIGPEDILAYVYGILHAPTYRARYADFLKEDLPHIPLAPAAIARELIATGRDLAALHLLESNVSSAVRLIGPGTRLVEMVRYLSGQTEDDGAIRINASQTLGQVSLAAFEVLPKWLKERKGRELSVDDLTTFQRIVGAIERTLELTSRLQELIDDAGGLPCRIEEGDASDLPAHAIGSVGALAS